MTENITLEASVREVVGKHVRHYRRQGQIPATVYGPGFSPMNLFIGEPDLRRALAKAGGTQLIELQLGKETITTLAREVQRHPIRGDLLHVDFYRVAMDRVIRAEIPVVLAEESAAVASREAIAIQHLNSIEIETLPGNLPPHIEVDMSQINAVGEQVTVGDLKLPSTIRIITPLDEVVVRLDYAETMEEEVKEGEELEIASVSAEPEVITARKEEGEEGEEE
ncbi:MAG: 50S ribosomal protein L25 [Anaerolineae bacterium]|nr:50S ribosomal protein L25 [Anaerolineae bacterium]